MYRFRVCSIVKNFHLFGSSVSVDQLIIGLMIPRSIAPIEHRYSVLLLIMFVFCWLFGSFCRPWCCIYSSSVVVLLRFILFSLIACRI